MTAYKIIKQIENPLREKPLIGSGKISRRVVITPYKPYSFNTRKRSKRFSPPNKKVKSNPIRFPDQDVKLVFEYWNRLGHPFVHHRPIWSKTTSKAISRIKEATDKYDREKVMLSITTIHELFKSPEFKYRLYYGKRKLSLPDFFRYDQQGYRKASVSIKDLPRSWFKEALTEKRRRRLDKKYSVVFKDKNPDTTKQLIRIWGEYDRSGKITRKVKNQLIKASAALKQFCESNNNLDQLTVIDLIDGMLNKWKSSKPLHAGYLRNSIFWNESLPKELVRYGLYTDESEIHEIDI